MEETQPDITKEKTIFPMIENNISQNIDLLSTNNKKKILNESIDQKDSNFLQASSVLNKVIKNQFFILEKENNTEDDKKNDIKTPELVDQKELIIHKTNEKTTNVIRLAMVGIDPRTR